MPRPPISQNGLAIRRNIVFTPELSDWLEEHKRSKGVGYSESVRRGLELYKSHQSDPDSQISQQKQDLEAVRLNLVKLDEQKGIEQRKEQELSAKILEGEKLLIVEKARKDREENEAAELGKLKVEYEGYPKEQRDSAWKRVLAKTKSEERRSETDKMRLVVQELKQEVIA